MQGLPHLNKRAIPFFPGADIQELGDLGRFLEVTKKPPSGPIVKTLHEKRKGRRNDYPFAASWMALLAQVYFQHLTDVALLRELKRNGQLRAVCKLRPSRNENSR